MTRPDGLADNPIYLELGSLGVKQKSLAPAGLLDYENLLHCPEVERRIGSAATQLERAEALAEAIIEAVASIKDKTQQKIAEAVLCTHEDYVGKIVKERKDLLAKDGITAEKFKKERPLAVAHVVAFLSTPSKSVRPLLQLREPEDTNQTLKLHHIKRDAFELYCAGLASAYTDHIEQLVNKGQLASPVREYFDACAKYLFDALVIFVSNSCNNLVEHQEPFWEWVERKGLESGTADWVVATTQQIYGLCSMQEVVDPEAKPVELDFMGILNSGLHIRDIYTEIWRPWYFDHWFGSSFSATVIRELTVKSGALALTLGQYVGTDQWAEEVTFKDSFQPVELYCGRQKRLALLSNEYDAFGRHFTTAFVKEQMR
jgi:hypothetical protein